MENRGEYIPFSRDMATGVGRQSLRHEMACGWQEMYYVGRHYEADRVLASFRDASELLYLHLHQNTL